MQNLDKGGTIFLCFHYLQRSGPFRRIWGYDFELFKKNIDFLIQEFPPIDFQQLNDFLGNKGSLPESSSILSFDDGLKEHVAIIAPYLEKKGIKAIFSAPACIFQGEMAPPQVIHFTTARYGIRKFYQFIRDYFSITGLNFSDYFQASWENLEIFDFYGKIKQALLYQLPPKALQSLLSAIFLNVLQKDYPHILEEVYFNQKDLAKLSQMGHQIACHTYSHFSLNAVELSKEFWQKEVLEPKQFLETLVGKEIDIFTYPYRSAKNKFNFSFWTEKLKETGFKYGLNAYRDFQGNNNFDPFWIERYSMGRNDTSEEIKKNSCRYFF